MGVDRRKFTQKWMRQQRQKEAIMAKGLKITGDLYKKVSQQEQVVSIKIPKSTDEDIQVFEFEPMKKYMFYFPSTVGGGELPQIVHYEHSIKSGQYSLPYRCSQNLAGLEEYGISGECHACSGMREVYDVFNEKVIALKLERGVSDDDKESMKKIFQDAGATNPMERSKEFITVPFVCFPVTQDPIKKTISFVTDEENKIVHYARLYTWSRKTFNDKFGQALSNNELSDIAGTWWLVSYEYDVKEGKQPTKMDAGRLFTPTYRQRPEALFQEGTGVTDESLQELIDVYTDERINGALTRLELLTDEEMKKVVDRALLSYRQTKKVLEARTTAPTGALPQSPEDALKHLGNVNVKPSDFPI